MIALLALMFLPTLLLVLGAVFKSNIMLWIAVGLQILISYYVRSKTPSKPNAASKQGEAMLLIALFLSSVAFGLAGIVILILQYL